MKNRHQKQPDFMSGKPLPHHLHLSGNKQSRLNPTCSDFLQNYITNELAEISRKPGAISYSDYKSKAKEHHPDFRPVSWPTFNLYLLKEDREKLARKQGGRRLANANAEPSPVEERNLSAQLPFEMGTMDHYLADIMCVVIEANGFYYVARPWISALLDINTGVVLAYWISFKSPSSRSCAVTIRRAVRRYSRIPKAIIVDRGADFRSVYFSAVMAHCTVDLVTRPAAHPRYGSEVERLFGEFKSRWLKGRPGNTVDFSKVRSISRSCSPEKLAVMPLEHFLSEFQAFCEVRDTFVSGKRVVSKIKMLNRGLKKYSCTGVIQKEDDEFILATAVDVREYKVDPVRGLHIDVSHYWHPALAHLAARKRPAEVRMEPENPFRVYAKINNEWFTCHCSGAVEFSAKEPSARLVDALRIGDGQAARAIAKEDADHNLIKRMHESNNELSALVATTSCSNANHCDSEKQIPGSPSIFDQIAEDIPDDLDTTTWGEEA